MLRRLFEYFDRNEKGLYWVFMWFIVSPWIRKVFEQYWGKPWESPEETIASLFYLLSFLVWSIGGRRLWIVLQQERFDRTRNVVVAFGGFFLLHFLYFFVLIIVSIIVDPIIGKHLPGFFGAVILLLVGFLPGCWLGHRFDRFIWLWCGLGSLVAWLTINFTSGDKRIDDYTSVIPWLLAVILGAYFWRSRLIEKKDATFLTQEMKQMLEDEGSIRE